MRAKGKDVSSLEAMANEDLYASSEWLAENKLSLNISKTNYLYFNMRRNCDPLPNLEIGSSAINAVSEQKLVFGRHF